MPSQHAFILALLTGALALVIVLGGLLSLDFLNLAGPYLARHQAEANATATTPAPIFTTTVDAQDIQILQVDAFGQPIKTIYTSHVNDQIADFNLIAVPQTHYDGKIYVESVQDEAGATLIVYPLNVDTGKVSPAVLNVSSTHATVSPDQDRIAVIDASAAKTITAYDIASGTALKSWSLNPGERFTESKSASRAYADETGVRWISNTCFDHGIWSEAGMEVRTFCIN